MFLPMRTACAGSSISRIKRRGAADMHDDAGKKTTVTDWSMPEIASTKIAAADALMKAGSRLYLGGSDHITVIEWDAEKKTLTPSWNLAVEGHVVRLIAADDRLIAVTREGRIYCFAGQETEPVVHVRPKVALAASAPAAKAKVEHMLAAAKTRDGIRRRLGHRRRATVRKPWSSRANCMSSSSSLIWKKFTAFAKSMPRPICTAHASL